MKKKRSVYSIFVLVLTLFLWSQTLTANAEVIQLNYKILSSNSTDESIALLSKLKAKNIGSGPIYSVRATVFYVNNIAIDISQVYFGDIKPGQNIESTESFTISLKNSSSQEPLQKEIVWQIEYTDVNGNSILEKISLK